MAIVLSDVYSVIRLASDLSDSPTLAGAKLGDTYHLIENLVLCDKLLFEKTRGERWAVASSLSAFTTPIEFITFSSELSTPDPGYGQRPYGDTNGNINDPSPRNSAQLADNFLSRSSDYLCQARKLGVYLSLHPSRNSFLVDALKHTLTKKASDIVISHTENIMQDSQAYQYASVKLSVPPVVDYVFGFAKRSRVNVATAVNEIRESDHARKFRRWCAEIDVELANATGRSSISLIQRLLSETEKVVSSWRVDLDEGVTHVSRTISLKKVWGIGPLLEALSLDTMKIKDPFFLSPKTSSLFFLNDIYRPIHGVQQNDG